MIVTVTFAACLIAFTAIGVLSSREAEATTEDYLVAGRNVPAWLTALSSVATNNSGFMFIGLIGFTYRFGVQAVWLQLGWVIGDWLAWTFVHQKIRQHSGDVNANSVPGIIGERDGVPGAARALTIAAAFLTFFFLAGYAAAQLKAGGSALEVLFGWDPRIGATIGIVIVVAYCFSGGLRASIWTDAAQAFVMLGSMAVLLAMAVIEIGGLGALFETLEGFDPALVAWAPDGGLAAALMVLGFVAGGLGAVGQPHIVIRTMALESPDRIPRAKMIYFLWFVPFSIATVAIGLYARAIMPELAAGLDANDAALAAEQALPVLSVALLPDVLVGLMLAGLFAATMSTADSQILSCSAAVTQDVLPGLGEHYIAGKIATLSVAVLALAIALFAGEDVFDLVLVAWSALGATLGPVIIVRVMGWRLSQPVGLAMMASGLATVVLWQFVPGSDLTFKLLPGMIVPMVLYGASRLVGRSATT